MLSISVGFKSALLSHVVGQQSDPTRERSEGVQVRLADLPANASAQPAAATSQVSRKQLQEVFDSTMAPQGQPIYRNGFAAGEILELVDFRDQDSGQSKEVVRLIDSSAQFG